MPLRARLAVLVAASFVVAAAFFATLTGGEPREDGPARFEGSLRPPTARAAELTGLRDQDGRPASLAEYRGRPVVVTFLYTTCEDTCPLTAQQIRGALDDLGEDVPALAVAVDPPRDTPARARRFLAEQRLTGRLRFLLGSEPALRRQWRAYGIQRQSAKEEHSGYTILLDGEGRQRIGFPADQVTPDRLAHDLRLLGAGR